MSPPLTEIQTQAIELLSLGKSVGDIAETLGIHRKTLWRWRQEPEFGTAWNAERARTADQLRSNFEKVMNAALNVIEQELTQEPSRYNRERQLPVALALLRILNPSQFLFTPPENRPNSLHSSMVALENGEHPL